MYRRAAPQSAPAGRITRTGLRSLLWFNRKAKRAAIRIVGLTHGMAVHPKHLVGQESAWWRLFCRGRVLDVGCGTGAAARFMPMASFVVGVDRDVVALRIAHGQNGDRVNRWHLLSIVRADLRDGLPFRSGSFDTVLCHDVLEHLDDRQALLHEIRRVLAPDGHLLLGVPNGATSWKRTLANANLDSRSDPDHRIEYTEAVLRRELADGGFTITARHPGILDTPWTGVFDVLGALWPPLYRRFIRWRQRAAVTRPDDDAAFYVICR